MSGFQGMSFGFIPSPFSGSSPSGTSVVVVQSVIGSGYTISGSSEAVTGLDNGSTAIVCDAFADVRVSVNVGGFPIPSINPQTGGMYFTKADASNTIALTSGNLSTSDLVIITTIPN